MAARPMHLDGKSIADEINDAVGAAANFPLGAVADATDATDVITQLNALLAELRTAGVISS